MAFVIEKSPSVNDLAYCAGIIDGEGYIGFMRSRNGDCFGGRVGVGNTNHGLVEWLASEFGSRILVKYGPQEHCKAQWNVFWDGRRGRDFLRAIYPYLRVKRPQARILMSYFQIMDDYRTSLGVKKIFKRSPTVFHLQDLVHQKLVELNRRGDSWRF